MSYRQEAQGVGLESERRLLQTIAEYTTRKKEEKNKQDLSKIPGEPWIDYPLYHEAPPTSFSCHRVPAVPGMYANVETGCQVGHTLCVSLLESSENITRRADFRSILCQLYIGMKGVRALKNIESFNRHTTAFFETIKSTQYNSRAAIDEYS